VIIYEEELVIHYGTPRHSGRYPWGSGEDEHHENTRNKTLNQEVSLLRSKGVSEINIAKSMGYETTTQLRKELSKASQAERQDNINMAFRLQEKGMSTNAIAKRMNVPESTARAWLKSGNKDKETTTTTVANMLKQQVDEKGFIDVGGGVEHHINVGTVEGRIGVSSTMLGNAISKAQDDGYQVHSVYLPRIGAEEHQIRFKVLGPPGSTRQQAWEKRFEIQPPTPYSTDGGRTFSEIKPPKSISSKRIAVRHKGEGGEEADGVIWVRPGVKDVELGGVNYAQVRVMVDKSHFIKGMAVYKEDMPDGVDLVFNTSKPKGKNKLDALKELEADPDLPFGSVINRQILDKPGHPDAKPTSVMNVINDDADWAKWSRTLSSQMLSKQSPKLAKAQLDMTYQQRLAHYENIKALTNPTVRKKLLMDFAGDTDSAAVHLKAAAMPRQEVKVILPVSTLSPNHVYAPSFKHGDTVVLVRFPHGGTFEIPQLTVNNRHAESKKLLGDAKTAIGINHKVAQQLSGADFDGDTVLVIPNRSGRITTSHPLEQLKNFDPIAAYPGHAGMRRMSKDNTQTEMGKISNLITDMTLKGAPHDEIAKAIKHSMVVIDAEKHGLDYRASYTDNGIKDLKAKYQRQPDTGKVGGAATLISRKKTPVWLPETKPRPYKEGGPIDKETGELKFVPTGRVDKKTGKVAEKKFNLLGETKDAFTLSSGTPVEAHYARHSNQLKSLANQARLDAIKTPTSKALPSAKKTYAEEVASLDAKLKIAQRNAPIERQAQLLANSKVRMKRNDNPNMDSNTVKKVKQQAINEERAKLKANKTDIEVTPKEWDAIQAGAISDSKLSEILTHADMKIIRQYATPKPDVLMTLSMTKRASDMLALGYTRKEVADQLGVSLSTLDIATNE
jgi:CENP-B N-terminal DNA-binding domain